MLNVFGWLRAQARAAVLGGVSDALGELATDDEPADLERLRKLLAEVGGGAKALPAAAGEAEPAKGRRAR